MSEGLNGVRQAAKERQQERFTNLGVKEKIKRRTCLTMSLSGASTRTV
jgi:hypothetical protein